MLAHVREQLLVDPLGGAPQGQLAQRGQIAGREEMTNRALRLLRHIDLALIQPLDQVLGRKVDHFDVVGLIEHAVGHGLAHPDPGDPGDHVVEALDVLDVQRREYVDAGGDQLLDIEIALGVAGARGVGVGQLVDQHELRAPLQDRVEIHLGQKVALVLDLLPGNGFEAVEQRLGLAPAVRLDDADHDIDPLAPLGLGRLQHLVRLAHAGSRSEKDLEPAAPLLPGRRQQRLRRRSSLTLAHKSSLAHLPGAVELSV